MIYEYSFQCVYVLEFNIPPAATVIWKLGHGLKFHPTNWRSQGLNLQPGVYNESGLATIEHHMLCGCMIKPTLLQPALNKELRNCDFCMRIANTLVRLL